MAGQVLINLTTGMEDPEKVTLAFLVATAALEQGRTDVVIWTTEGGRPARASRTCAGCGVRGLPAARAALSAVRRRRREALAVPDLRQRARPRRRAEGGERDGRGRDPRVAVGGGRPHRLQLLTPRSPHGSPGYPLASHESRLAEREAGTAGRSPGLLGGSSGPPLAGRSTAPTASAAQPATCASPATDEAELAGPSPGPASPPPRRERPGQRSKRPRLHRRRGWQTRTERFRWHREEAGRPSHGAPCAPHPSRPRRPGSP